MTDPLVHGEIRETAHRERDDLLSAGLGLAGLRASPDAFAAADAPSAAELRRRSIQTSWKGIADLGPLGGYGSVYGAVPDVPGREFQAFAQLHGARAPHRVLVQVPDRFDTRQRCLVVTAASGSRGIYGAIALAGAWGLPRGCAVAYTDKGAGTGYVDAHGGVALDGRRIAHGGDRLEFDPAERPGDESVAIKHAHSGDHPEADWGRHLLQAARFGLAMLDRALPALAPFTADNTRIIAVGLSNGAAAALQAAGLDDAGMLDGVVALAPNVHVANAGRPLFDYATEAAQLLPCALADPAFAGIPFARPSGGVPAAWSARAVRLRDCGVIDAVDTASASGAALDRLLAHGWSRSALETAAATTVFDLWRALGACYASAYLRRTASTMPCGFRYVARDAAGTPASVAQRAAWWSDASGIPPAADISLVGGSGGGVDPSAPGIEALRALWTGDDVDARTLRAAVAATAAKIPRRELKLMIVHGESDGLLPIAFSSSAYVDRLQAAGLDPCFWRVPHAQHFDAFLALPGFGERHVPLLAYGYAALDRLVAALDGTKALPPSHRFATAPRGVAALSPSMLALDGVA